jgi:ubiquinone/menaquinone biosynthesis C-methylase UbiE
MTGKLSRTLESAYNEQYSDEMTEWRELGGKHKAQNIIDVCGGHHFRNVLECGAGEGGILEFLDRASVFDELSAIEISESGISQIKKRNLSRLREVRKFDGYQIPYPDKHFSMAFCSHVIEHVEHPRILLRELKRVSDFQVFEIPLDFSVGVDRRVQLFLSYGHINIYTPSLFRFLLKTEGFQILKEKLAHLSPEEARYRWYYNHKLKMPLKACCGHELKLRLVPLRRAVTRLIRGRAWHQEYGFSAYTCLARGDGELNVLGDA